VGVARLGSASQKIITASLEQMACIDLGDPLHSLVVTGHLHFLECDMLRQFAFDDIVYMKLTDSSPRQ
jgi:diphthine synthase